MFIKKLIRLINRVVSRILSYIKFPKLSINNVSIHHQSKIIGKVHIGSYTIINGPAYISGADDGCFIGKYCAIAHNLRVRVANHETKYLNMQAGVSQKLDLKDVHGASKGQVKIGNGVWIADNVIILSGVTIGNGAIIGAGAVVTKDVEPYAIAAGNPARLIKHRVSKDNIQELEKIKWWEWSESKIKKNKNLFKLDLTKPIKNIRNHVL